MKTKFKMSDRMWLPPNMSSISRSIPGTYADSNGMIIVSVDVEDVEQVSRILALSSFGTLEMLRAVTNNQTPA